MKMIRWISQVLKNGLSPRRVAAVLGAALLTTGFAAAQDAQVPAPGTQPVAPQGYTLHEAIDVGGHMVGISGSGSMYDTLVNMQSGPRILGGTFDLEALPGAEHLPFDSLKAYGYGFGGDPYNFAKVDLYKGRLYDFSGMFRRDRQYFDYDLLGNPNIPSGQSLSGVYPWPQVQQSPFLFNTVRRMTDTGLTLLPLSKITYRAAYSQNVFQGPSLTPSGYQFAGSYDVLLQEMQRNSADDFIAGIDWKPIQNTRLTFEEQVDHYKMNSYFVMDPSYFRLQEPDGTPVALLANYDALTPTAPACNTNSTGTTPVLSAPATAGGLPIVNPACGVITSYTRMQPTRLIFPTEIFRFQSSSIRNISMNGDVRYTQANMNMPVYYDNFQGLTKSSTSAGVTTPPYRSITYSASGSAKREVFAADYGIVWQASSKFSFDDQVSYSNVQQPGSTTMTSLTRVATPITAGSETINSPTLTTTVAAAGTATFEGSGSIGAPSPDFFGQRFISNDLTGTWDGWSRASLSLTYRHNDHVIEQGIPHNAPLAVGSNTNGTVTIHQDGGILGATLRPTDKWDVNGTAEVLYADNAFTPVAPRQLQHYRIHTLYRVKPWATVSGAYNDMELHNDTNNNQADIVPAFSGSATGAAYAGPLDHVAHSRVASIGAQIYPKERYGLDFNYAYSDVYTATNICYLGGSSAALPVAAAPPNGSVCPSTAPGRSGVYDFGPVKDFEDAPTQSGSVALSVAPTNSLHSNIGYRISSVNGTRFYNDPRDVAGSLVSTYQTPFVDLAYTYHTRWVWKAQYDYYGYGEGGPSGAAYCSTSDPVPTSKTNLSPVSPAVVACSSLTGVQTGMTISPAGETAPRNFHANNVTLGMHYEF